MEVVRDDMVKSRGTEVHVVLEKKLGVKVRMGSSTDAYKGNEFDPFSIQNDLIYYKIFDALNENVEDTYFPIKIYFDKNLIKILKTEQQVKNFEKKFLNNRYMVKRKKDYSMYLWDCKTYTGISLSLQEGYLFNRYACSFKGIQVSGCLRNRVGQSGITIYADFCGLETKQTLTIDRKQIKKEAELKIDKILQDAIQIYLCEIEKELMKEDRDKEQVDYNKIYMYWSAVPFKKKLELLGKYKIMFRKIRNEILVLKKTSNSRFEIQKLDFKEIMKNLEQVATICGLESYCDSEVEKVKKKLETVNMFLKKRKIPFSIIIIDDHFSALLEEARYKKLVILSYEKETLFLASHTIHEEILIDINDEETKQYLIKTLLKEYLYQLGEPDEAIRRFMPGIKKYIQLCTMDVPDGVVGEWDFRAGYIISPITLKQWREYRYLEYQEFIKKICSSIEYCNLVDYVYNHQLEEKKYSKKEIEEAYGKLIKEMCVLAGKTE